MTSYQSRNQIFSELEEMIPEQVKECKECDELPRSLEELIIHNFQAKFVCYNKEDETVEVGIEDYESMSSYPSIKTRTFPLDKAKNWIRKSFREEEPDPKFYGKLIAGNGRVNQVDDVVLV